VIVVYQQITALDVSVHVAVLMHVLQHLRTQCSSSVCNGTYLLAYANIHLQLFDSFIQHNEGRC
jgi:hypothetical protein